MTDTPAAPHAAPAPPPDLPPDLPPVIEPIPMQQIAPAPTNACGYVTDGIHRHGATPVVARLTAAYTAGEQTLLCASCAALFPDTVTADGQEIATKEKV